MLALLAGRHQPTAAGRCRSGNFPGAAVRTSTPKFSGRFCARPLSGARALSASRTFDFRPAADSYRSANGRRTRRAGVPSTQSSSRPTTSTRWRPRWPREAASSGTQYATTASSAASCSWRPANSLSNSSSGANSRGGGCGHGGAAPPDRRCASFAPTSRCNASLTRETGPARVTESACRKRCLFQLH